MCIRTTITTTRKIRPQFFRITTFISWLISWFLLNLKKITCKCDTELYWNVSNPSGSTGHRHTRMQDVILQLESRQWRREREREGRRGKSRKTRVAAVFATLSFHFVESFRRSRQREKMRKTERPFAAKLTLVVFFPHKQPGMMEHKEEKTTTRTSKLVIPKEKKSTCF